MSRSIDVVIVGGTSGIGRAIAACLLARGERVCMAGRSQRPLSTVEQAAGPRLSFECVDLASEAELSDLGARLAAAAPRRLVHCAGGISTAPAVTQDGSERRFVVNHLARVRITEALLPAGLERIAYLSAWGTYRRPPRNYVYDKPGRGGPLAARNAYIPNDAYFRELAERRPELSILAINPRATRGTDIAARPDVPGALRMLTRAWFAITARPVDAVAAEIVDHLDRTPPGIRFIDGGRPVPAPTFTLEPRPWEA